MTKKLHKSAQKIQDALYRRGFSFQVVELPDSTRTAQDAARAIGCEVGQIAKSLVFVGKETGDPVLVIASGVNFVDTAKVMNRIGEPVGKADADFVRNRLGYVIGGVPPVGHAEPVVTLIDADLLRYPRIWAAAGTPHAVFALDSSDLPGLTGGKICDIKRA